MDDEIKLWNFFQNTNDWLRYAEQKNGYMLSFITIQIGIFGFIAKDPSSWNYPLMVKLGLVVLVASFLLSASSFLPFKRKGQFKLNCHFPFLNQILPVPKGIKEDDDLILCHEDMVKYDFVEFREKINECLENKLDKKKTNLLTDMILINGRIWNIKFRIFNRSCFVNVIGFILIMVGIIFK